MEDRHAAMKWKIDEIVNPQVGKHAKQFECSICYAIWDDPVETPCCENTFCRVCLTQCAACPICRLPLGVPKECSKSVLRMLNNIDVRCPHHCGCETASGSPDGGEPAAKRQKSAPVTCTWEGTYGDLLSKHIGQCPLHPVPCPRECGEFVLRKDLDRHAMTCTRSFEKCHICGEMVKPGQMPEHRREAAELHVQLLEERLEEERGRVDRAVAERATLEDVLASIKAIPKSQQSHVTSITRLRAEDIKYDVQKQMCKKVVWKIRGARSLMNHPDYPKGEYLQSPKFSLVGIDLYLMLFPKGRSESEAHTSCIQMIGVPRDRRLHVRYTINANITKEDQDCLCGVGFIKWPKTRAILDSISEEEDMIIVEVEVLSMAHVMTQQVF